MPRITIKERRRHKRIRVGLPIKIEYNKEKIATKTKDISALGTYIETDKEIPIGTTLNLKIKIPKTRLARTDRNRQISCRGIVFRCQPTDIFESKNRYGIGIFFRLFPGEGEKNLSKYIDYILSQERKIGKIYIRKRKQRQLKRKGGKG